MTREPTDCERLLKLLREWPAGVHSHAIRNLGVSGNPSQRVRELRDRGFNIESKRENRGKRPGVRYTLRGTPGSAEGGRPQEPAKRARYSADSGAPPSTKDTASPPAERVSGERPGSFTITVGRKSVTYRPPEQLELGA
jgi:hypothetical protein